MDEILIRVGELFLKSEPVIRIFEKRLRENIKVALKREGIRFKITRTRGRLFVHTKEIKKACDALKTVFGIVSFSPCYHLRTSSLKRIQNFCKRNYDKWIKRGQTFGVKVRRIGDHAYTSQQLAKAVGDVIDRKVDLSKPDVEVGIEVRDNDCYIYTETIKGLGGLPVGVSGKVLCLISGGIDSPVAAWLMMKRGCKIALIHFHSFPLLSKRSIEKTKELAKVLKAYQRRIKIYFVPFQSIQTEIKTKVLAKYRIILYRRYMLRIAEAIAKRENAKALVTGESLAQVSSQTLENIATIEAVTSMPVLRPLIGMDKSEIIDLAKKIKTYKVSIKPQEDCCTLFIPKHPATRSSTKRIEELEKRLDTKMLVEKAIKASEAVQV